MLGNRAAGSPWVGDQISLRPGGLALALAAALAACAPPVGTPSEAAYARDQRDAAALAATLRRLPLVREVHVTLTRPVADPLSGIAPAPAAAAALVVHDPRASSAALAQDVRALVAAAAPEVPAQRLTVLTRPSEPPPVLATVGPFSVARESRSALLAALLGLLGLCAALAGALAWRERGRLAAETET